MIKNVASSYSYVCAHYKATPNAVRKAIVWHLTLVPALKAPRSNPVYTPGNTDVIIWKKLCLNSAESK